MDMAATHETPAKDESTPLLAHPKSVPASSTLAPPPACTPNCEMERPYRQPTTSLPERNQTSSDTACMGLVLGRDSRDLSWFVVVQVIALTVLTYLISSKGDSARAPNDEWTFFIWMHAWFALFLINLLDFKNSQRWNRCSAPPNPESQIQQEEYEWNKKRFVSNTRILGYASFLPVFEEVGIAVYLLYLDWINSAWNSVGLVVELLLVLLLGAACFYLGIPVVKFEVEGPKPTASRAREDGDVEGGRPAVSSHSPPGP